MGISMTSRRKDRKKERSDEVRIARRRRAREILAIIGLWEHLHGSTVEDRFQNAYYPRIELTCDDQVAPDLGSRILRELEKALKKATFNAPLLGPGFSVIEYFSNVKPILDLLHASKSATPVMQAALLGAQERTTALGSDETAVIALCELFQDLDAVLIRFGRIDQRLFFLQCQFGRNQAKKWFVRFVLHQVIPETRKFQTRKGPRSGHRCGQPFGQHGIEWVEWPASALGIEGDQVYSVFVQGHALDNLYRNESEARALFIEDGEWLVHDYLWQSLRKPKIHKHPTQAGVFLVEYWLNMHKIGYLVGQKADNAVLIDTFLFLTMDGTPEGQALWRKLRLQREDKIQIGLDRIQTFLLTDVQFDPDIVAILNECGCGHLFKIMKEMPKERYVTGYAEEIRQYLRMT
jgi:hypothetical protein